jgi:regulator of replication initiation timing
LNYPSTLQNASPHRPIYPTNHEHSANKKSIQQKQIEDLELKVDLILEHNDKLVNENTELKKKLAEAEIIGNEYLHKERLSRYQVAE